MRPIWRTTVTALAAALACITAVAPLSPPAAADVPEASCDLDPLAPECADDPYYEDPCVLDPTDPLCLPVDPIQNDPLLGGLPVLDPFLEDPCLVDPTDPWCDIDFVPLPIDELDDFCSIFPDDAACDAPADGDGLTPPIIDDDPLRPIDPDDGVDLGGLDPGSGDPCLDDPFGPGCALDPCYTGAGCGTDAVAATGTGGSPSTSTGGPPAGPAAAGGPATDPVTAAIVARWDAASAAGLITAMQSQLLTEIDVLMHLGAFAEPPEQFELIAERFEGDAVARFELIRDLAIVDYAGALLAKELEARDLTTSAAVATALAPVPLEIVRSIQDGKGQAIDPEPYLRALSDALYREGRATSTGAAELPLDEVEALLDSMGFAPPVEVDAAAPAPPPTPTPGPTGAPTATPEPPAELAFQPEPEPRSASPMLAIGIAAAALLAIGGGAAATATRRRSGRRDLPAPVAPSTDAADAAPGVTALLDASRRMSRSLVPAEIAGIAVEEAMTLLGAEGGAFIARGDSGLELLAEQPRGLVVPAGLEAGVMARVTEAGQPTYAVADNDPGLTTLPVAYAAVPVIAGGGVTGVLMVVRSSMAPFDATSIEHLGMLAPIAGSALAAADDHASVAELASVDALTGLNNRRKLDEDLLATLADPAQSPVSFAMIDVDHFKTYNDTHGHGAGDVALQHVARLIQAAVRETDATYRYGGEEFSVLLPQTGLATAHEVAERVRRTIDHASFPGEDRQPNGSVTVSIGVATAPTPDADALRRTADAALYAAKDAGRNRVQRAN